MKKTLAVVLSVLMIVTACLSVSAISLETVENAAEAAGAVIAEEKEAEAALASAITPSVNEADRYHSSYGTLIYYNDFEMYEEGATIAKEGTDTNPETWGLLAKQSNGGSGSIVDAITCAYGDDVDNIAAQISLNAVAAYPQLYFSLQNSPYGAGDYTVLYDANIPADKTKATTFVFFKNGGTTQIPAAYVEGTSNQPAVGGGWYTLKAASTRESAATAFAVGYKDSKVATDTIIVDNIKIYFKEYVDVTAENLNLPEGITGGYISSINSPTASTFTAADGIENVLLGSQLTLYVPGYTFMGWYDAEDNRHIGFTDASLKAKWRKHAPGINILTGTTEKADFEDGNRYGIGLAENDFSSSEVAANPNTSNEVNTSAKALKADKAGSTYGGLHLPVKFEVGRKYTVMYSLYAEMPADEVSPQGSVWFYDLSGNNSTLAKSDFGISKAKNNWINASTEITPTYSSSSRLYLFIQQKFVQDASTAKNDTEKPAAANKINAYYDNMAVYPWYKVNYYAADGETLLASDQVSYATTQITFSTTKRPEWTGEGNMEFIGWSTEGVNGKLIETGKMALNYEDVDLYPVYKDMGDLYLRDYLVAANTTGHTVTVANKTVDGSKTSWNEGLTEAKVTFNEASNSFTVVGAKYSGEITVNLAFTDGTTAVNTIKLVGGNKWRPGLNTFTGTQQPLNFDEFETADLSKVFREVTANINVRYNPDKTGINTSDKMVAVTAQYNYSGNVEDFDPYIEATRPSRYMFDVKTNATRLVMVNSWSGNNIYVQPASTTTAWTSQAYNLCMANNTGSLKGDERLWALNNGIKYVGIGAFGGTYGYETEGKSYHYYDNLSFIPSYKITYECGEEDVVEYILYADAEKTTFATSYTVKTDIPAVVYTGEGLKKFVGWSTTKGATEPMTTVALNYADVVLYPVFAETDSAIDGAAIMSGKTGETGTFKFVKDIDAAASTFTAGTTDVTTVVFDEATNTCTVTAAGYSGIVTLNLVYADASTGTAEVKLFGGSKWRPGLNAFTGTADPLDFEEFVTSDLAKALSNGSGNTSSFSVQPNPDKTGSNTSDKMVSISSQFQYLFNVAFDTYIEPARSVYYRYDVKSDKGQYFMLNSWGGDDVYARPGSSTSWKINQYTLCMKSSTGEVTAATKKAALQTDGMKIIGIGTQSGTYAYETAGKNYQYIDNLSLIPAYKITYECGEEDVVDYILYSDEADYVIATSYTVKTDIPSIIYTGEGLKKHIGWSTTEGATEPMTTVALNYKDIDLYPVFAETDSAIDDNALMSGKTGTAATFKFVKAIDAEKSSFTAGTTDVTSVVYNEADNSCTVTAAGYSGIVTLNLVYADASTGTAEVKLRGGEKWKPGLNLLTGTTEKFGFENADENTYSFEFSNVQVIENPVESDVNTSDHVALFSGSNSTYPIITTKMTQVVEKERSLLFNMDVSGDWYCLWLISQADRVYADYSGWYNGGRPIAGWNTINNYTVQTGAGKYDFSMTRIQAKSKDDNGANPKDLYVDNVAFIPAYKFTYVDVDGTETVEYKIKDADGNIITTHTPVFASGATKYTVNGGEEVLEGAYALANADVVFTAVAAELTMEENVTTRFDVEDGVVTGGIRFKSSISDEDKSAFAEEYGFIVARKSHLTALGAELTVDFKHPTLGVDLFVKGVAYDKATGKDLYIDRTETHWVFTGVCVGIPTDTAANVKEELVARAYLRTVVGDKEVYVYGPANSCSLGKAMKAVQTEAGEDYTNNQEYVDAIVNLYEQE